MRVVSKKTKHSWSKESFFNIEGSNNLTESKFLIEVNLLPKSTRLNWALLRFESKSRFLIYLDTTYLEPLFIQFYIDK